MNIEDENDVNSFLEKLDKIDNSKKNVLIAYEKTMGNITMTMKACNLHRSNFYLYMTDPIFKRAIESIDEESIDLAESRMKSLIAGRRETYFVRDDEGNIAIDAKGNQIVGERWAETPDKTMIIFYLKTKGKKRGYIETNHTEHTGGGGLPLILDFFNPITAEEVEQQRLKDEEN